jgi:hypothetical protein
MARISEKHKFYFLIVMVMIAALIGYLRFLRPAERTEKQNTVSQTQSGQARSESTPLEVKPVKSHRPVKQNMARRHILRNIFEPAAPLEAIAATTPAAAQAAPLNMTLSGTVIGGEHAMAIINNRFMRPGQTIGKYRVMRITPDKVYLAAGEDRRCLSVLSVSEAVTE